MKGTKITYRGVGKPNPKKDNRTSMNNFDAIPKMKEGEYKKFMRDSQHCFIHISDDNAYGICKLWYKRFPFLLPEPNPVTFYYSLAFDACKQFDDCHSKLALILQKDITPYSKSNELAVAYSYLFKVNSMCIIFSFLAIEAFLNQQLPKYEEIIHKNKPVSKEKIERSFKFDQKINEVIPTLSGKDFGKVYPKQMVLIRELKNLRNELTHLKQQKGSGLTRYEALFQSVLDIDIKKIVRTVKQFVNFYYPRLIINYTYKATPVIAKGKQKSIEV
jgi:hypothetical protein